MVKPCHPLHPQWPNKPFARLGTGFSEATGMVELFLNVDAVKLIAVMSLVLNTKLMSNLGGHGNGCVGIEKRLVNDCAGAVQKTA